MINWVARFGWSVALLVGIFAALKEERCTTLAHSMPEFPQWSLQHVPYWPPANLYQSPSLWRRSARRPLRPIENHFENQPMASPPGRSAPMTITLKPYKSDKAIVEWVWTSPKGHVLSAEQHVVMLPVEMRR